MKTWLSRKNNLTVIWIMYYCLKILTFLLNMQFAQYECPNIRRHLKRMNHSTYHYFIATRRLNCKSVQANFNTPENVSENLNRYAADTLIQRSPLCRNPKFHAAECNPNSLGAELRIHSQMYASVCKHQRAAFPHCIRGTSNWMPCERDLRYF